MIYLDTHVVLWLYEGELDKISNSVQALLRNEALFVSPTVLLELQFLYEIKRIHATADNIFNQLAREIHLQLSDLPYQSVAQQAIQQAWTRDPFDRLIVAEAAVESRPLMTKDRLIRKHYPSAVW